MFTAMACIMLLVVALTIGSVRILALACLVSWLAQAVTAGRAAYLDIAWRRGVGALHTQRTLTGADRDTRWDAFADRIQRTRADREQILCMLPVDRDGSGVCQLKIGHAQDCQR